MIDDSNKCFGNSINQPSFKHVQFSLDFMCMNLAYQKRFLEKQMNVEVVLTLSDDFNNEPVFLKFDIIWSRKCTDLSTSTIDRRTSFLMYIIFSFSFLSFYPSVI